MIGFKIQTKNPITLDLCKEVAERFRAAGVKCKVSTVYLKPKLSKEEYHIAILEFEDSEDGSSIVELVAR